MVQPDKLRTRILLWAEEEARLGQLPPKADTVLKAVPYSGELPRGEIGPLLGQTDRNGHRVISALLELGVLASDGPRDVLRLAFPARLASRWMPGHRAGRITNV